MDKQVQIYSIDTSSFYNEEEIKIHRTLSKNYLHRSKLKKIKNKKSTDAATRTKAMKYYTFTNRRIKRNKSKLYKLFENNTETRVLRKESLTDSSIISVFDSVLTRTLKIKPDTLSTEIFVVQTYFFNVLKDLIKKGFIYNNEKYIPFTASAGQIRTKKTVFIKESTFDKFKNTLQCGLSLEKINSLGGVNINKYLAYLALCNSATDPWESFDIDKSIVVDDMETNVRSSVDFIDDNTYEIERKTMDIPINHTDGCGMMLPKVNKLSMMVRLPWMKGLLVPFPFDDFIKRHGIDNSSKIKDIYGKEYDILEDNIQVIFTKSQFKMHKYYSSWDEYKEMFKKYSCTAATCNEEELYIRNKTIGYQMLQTLTDITDNELDKLVSKSRSQINKIGSDFKTMLDIIGVDDRRDKQNFLQQALSIYPELLNDTYSKEVIKQVKKSLVHDARGGKVMVDGKYTFICPDLFAFSEFLFNGNENPNGLLKDGEVSCSLFKNNIQLDCLRSPHLYREHAIRMNVINKETKNWFVSKGIYTSCHDPISKLLMFDVDGDKALVCSDKTLVSVAKRNMKDIVPLYYNMAMSNQELISNDSIYNGLINAYTGGSIGIISNNISKIWNSENINLDVIKWLCLENNFVIDYAKTLYKPTRPQDKNKIIKQYTKSKLPHFFKYAKNKDRQQIENKNNSLVNRFELLIKNPRITFRKMGLGKFNHLNLMKNSDVELNQEIIDKYIELDTNKRFISTELVDEDYTGDNTPTYRKIREDLLRYSHDKDIYYIVDVLVKYLYSFKDSSYKTTLWSSFGDIIIENIKRNIESETRCEKCGIEIDMTSNRRKYCEPCWKEKRAEQNRENFKRWYDKQNI